MAAMVSFKIKVKNAKPIRLKLRRAERKIRDRSRPINQAKKYMIGRWKANYGGGGAIYGKWAPLSEHSYRRETTEGVRPLTPITGQSYSNFLAYSNLYEQTTESILWAIPPTFSSHGHHVGHNPRHPQVPRILWKMNGDDKRHIFDLMNAHVRAAIGGL